MDNLYSLKTTVIENVQLLFDDYKRLSEKTLQNNCEINLKLREYISVIKEQEDQNNTLLKKIKDLEYNNIKKEKQIHEYSELIKNFEEKVHELTIEKDEKERFNITRVQADTIVQKEKEIERLTMIVNKLENKLENKTKDKKVLNVIDIIEQQIPENDEISINVIKTGGEDNISDDKNVDDKTVDDKTVDDKILDEKDDIYYEDDDYEIITYRKKEYWIKNNENPQYVYEVINEDELGNRLGVYKKDKKGKMKVFLDK